MLDMSLYVKSVGKDEPLTSCLCLDTTMSALKTGHGIFLTCGLISRLKHVGLLLVHMRIIGMEYPSLCWRIEFVTHGKGHFFRLNH